MIRAMPSAPSRAPGRRADHRGRRVRPGTLERRSRENSGFHRAVRLLGRRDDIPELLRRLGYSLRCRRVRGSFSTHCARGMAAGRPVVAFATGGLPEIVRDGETGVVVPTGDTAGLATAILRLLNDDRRSPAASVPPGVASPQASRSKPIWIRYPTSTSGLQQARAKCISETVAVSAYRARLHPEDGCPKVRPTCSLRASGEAAPEGSATPGSKAPVRVYWMVVKPPSKRFGR